MGFMQNAEDPWVREALLFDELGAGKVKCNLCERRCVISPDRMGSCKTRRNMGGKLYTLQYGLSSGISPNPIEKKPFYHFWPGSLSLTVGSWGCNFTCPWCQNYHISKVPPDPTRSEYLSPEKFVELARRYSCRSTSVSFNEPTLSFEWSLDMFRLARREGLENTFVTNGYMTTEALKMLRDAGLDAINIDVKGDMESVGKYCGADVEVVWRNIRESKKLGMHVEVVNLVIPGVNDEEEQLRRLAKRHMLEAGKGAPLHFTAYYPAYKFHAPPTPVATLERAHDIAISEGLEFVYVGNVPGHRYENTYCPGCGQLLIERYGLEIVGVNLRGSRCPNCGREIPIVGGVRAGRGLLQT